MAGTRKTGIQNLLAGQDYGGDAKKRVRAASSKAKAKPKTANMTKAKSNRGAKSSAKFIKSTSKK